MIKSNESGAGKVIMKLQACLMICQYVEKRNSMEPEETSRDFCKHWREIIQRVYPIIVFLKGGGYSFEIISSRKC